MKLRWMVQFEEEKVDVEELICHEFAEWQQVQVKVVLRKDVRRDICCILE